MICSVWPCTSIPTPSSGPLSTIRLQRNRIVDSGPDDGVGIDVQGQTEQIMIAANEIRETRQPMRRVGVRIGAETKDIALVENQIEGFATAVARLDRP